MKCFKFQLENSKKQIKVQITKEFDDIKGIETLSVKKLREVEGIEYR